MRSMINMRKATLIIYAIAMVSFVSHYGHYDNNALAASLAAPVTKNPDTLSMRVSFHSTDSNSTGFFTVDSVTAKTISNTICPSYNCQVKMDNHTAPTMYKFGAEYIINANMKVSTTPISCCLSL